MGSEIKDPGIGTQFKRRTKRLINKDGSYNIIKHGGKKGFRDIFKYLLEISWGRFFMILFLGYISLNLIFTGLYLLVGYEMIHGVSPEEGPIFFQVFFFSIQTFTTVGYGALYPSGFGTQFIAAAEAFFGLLSFSIATGLAYGRFSRPNSKIIFSDKILYAKYQDGYSIKAKLVNERDNVLLEVSAKIILSMDKKNATGSYERTYYNLPLEIDQVELLPYTWTLVHKIDEESPFWGKTKDEICMLNPEFLILTKGFDEIFSQHVHRKRSYVAQEIGWDMQFKRIFAANDDGVLEFDINDINLTEDDH